MRITRRKLTEGGIFVAFIASLHYVYYKIQQNNSLVPPDQRTELPHMRWLKNKFPSLGNKIGIDDSKRLERDEAIKNARAAGATIAPTMK